MEQMEKIRKELNELVISSNNLCRGEVLRLSQELDKLIYLYYRDTNNCRENMKASLISQRLNKFFILDMLLKTYPGVSKHDICRNILKTDEKVR